MTKQSVLELIVSVTGSGTVTSDPAGIACPEDCTEEYPEGTTVTLTASPAAGWAFAGWSGDCTGTGSCVVSMTAPRPVTATFTQIQHTLTVSVSGSGTVTSDPAGINCPGDCTEDYAEGTTVTLTATPASGWEFAGWSGDCTGTGDCTLTMTSDRSVTATFTQQNTLTVSVTGSGTVTSNPAGISCPEDCTEEYPEGTTVTLTATPASGWAFAGWSGDCTGTGSCVVSMTAPRSVTATFSQTQHTLTVSVNGSGTVTSDPAGISCPEDCTEEYPEGTTVTLTAAPASGWEFAGWSGDCTGTGNCVVSMTAPRSVTATFTQIQHTLTVSVSGSGTVTSDPAGISCPEDCTEDYAEGTTVTLTATPASGWAFAGWSGDCTGTGSCVVTMTAPRSVTARFSQQHTLTVSVSGSGTVTSDPAGISCPGDCAEEYPEGTTVALHYSPASGWEFAGWGGDCTGTDIGFACVVEMTAPRSVTATFTQIQHTLTVSVSGSGTVTSDPAGISCPEDCTEEYPEGTTVILTATAASGSRFDHWEGDCSGTTLGCNLVMDRARQVTAVFVGPEWVSVSVSGTLPGPRSNHSAVYSAPSNEMIVFGGWVGSPSVANDVWVLHNADGTEAIPSSWSELTPAGNAPGPRAGHSAIYDPGSDRMIVFGGSNDGATGFSDVWLLLDVLRGAPTWVQMAPQGTPPSPRFEHTAVYDRVSNRMIIFGGLHVSGSPPWSFNDVWVLTNANGTEVNPPTWIELTPNDGLAPQPRMEHTAVYDFRSNRMIVFGGTEDGASRWFTDAWVLDRANGTAGAAAWTQLFPGGSAPDGFEGHSAVYDENSNRMIVFGGRDPFLGAGRQNGVWVLTDANDTGAGPAWIELEPGGQPPVPRDDHSAVHNQSARRMIIFGGGDDGLSRRSDVWILTRADGE